MFLTSLQSGDSLPWLFLYIGPGPGLSINALGPLLSLLLAALGMGFFLLRQFGQRFFSKLKNDRRFRLWVLCIILLVGGGVMWFWKKSQDQSAHVPARPKVVVLGIDGMDPNLLETYVEQGAMPNFARLQAQGTYTRLTTTNPAESPVAWSTFATGTNPGKHGLFDFIHRAAHTYLPDFALVRLENGRTWTIGGTTIPLEAPRYVSQRHGTPFWSLTSAADVATTVLRCPVTFPPEEVRGRMLSGMGVPDLRGSQGTFFYWTTEAQDEKAVQGGKLIQVRREGDHISTALFGPSISQGNARNELTIPFAITLDRGRKQATLQIQGTSATVRAGEWSPWFQVSFRVGFLNSLSGICRFYVKSIEPDFALYGSPLNFDPAHPPYPISYPKGYAQELTKDIGPYHTQGMPEDTWALIEGRLDEDTFLEQCHQVHNERAAMLWHELKRFEDGVLVIVFDTLDRVQHLFWRAIDTEHPLYTPELHTQYGQVIPTWYREFDTLLGNLLATLGDDTVLLVLSDHGFAPFRRAVHVNTWLRQQGYLRLQEQRTEGRGYGQDIDWTRTRAYALGIGGIYLNLKGREPQGVVTPGEEATTLETAIATELQAWTDFQNGRQVVRRVYRTEEVYQGPEVEHAPDLLIGFERGYRASWQTALGGAPKELIEDNLKKWSGDHIVDPDLVPGILLVNRPLSLTDPHLADIAPTILKMVGAKVPANMDGRVLW